MAYAARSYATSGNTSNDVKAVEKWNGKISGVYWTKDYVDRHGTDNRRRYEALCGMTSEEAKKNMMSWDSESDPRNCTVGILPGGGGDCGTVIVDDDEDDMTMLEKVLALLNVDAEKDNIADVEIYRNTEGRRVVFVTFRSEADCKSVLRAWEGCPFLHVWKAP